MIMVGEKLLNRLHCAVILFSEVYDWNAFSPWWCEDVKPIGDGPWAWLERLKLPHGLIRYGVRKCEIN